MIAATSSHPRPVSRSGAVNVAVVTAVCILGAALRLHHLGFRSYWLDEVVSVRLAHAAWPAFAATIRTTEANMALYYVVLRSWIQLGDGEASVRLLSCVFGVATLPVIYALGARLFDRLTGCFATLLLALNTGHLWASQEARSYALLVLLTVLSWLFLVVATQARTSHASWVAWGAYICTAALAVYAHFFAALVILAQAAVLPWLLRNKLGPRSLIVGVAALGVLLSPLVRFLFAGPHHNIDWIIHGHSSRLAALLFHVTTPTSRLALLEVVLLLLVGPVALAASWRRLDGHEDRWRFTVPMIWLLVPLVVVTVVSLAWMPVADERYLTICLPPLVLLAAVALTRLWPRPWSWSLLLVMVAVDAASLSLYFTRENEDWRGATAHILAHAQPRDAILFYAPYIWVAFDTYRRLKSVPADAPPEYPEVYAPLTRAVVDASSSAPRVWLVVNHVDSPRCEALVESYMRGRFGNSEVRDFNLIRVLVYAGPKAVQPTASAAFRDLAAACS